MRVFPPRQILKINASVVANFEQYLILLKGCWIKDAEACVFQAGYGVKSSVTDSVHLIREGE